MAMEAAIAALDDDEHVQRTRQMVQLGLKFFEDACTEMGLPFVPSVTNFMLVEVGEGSKVFEAAKHERVIVRAMDVYGLPSHVRITVGTKEENELCVRALKAVLKART
jgi:histidinol-phosphate aminotransferase